MLVMIRAQIFDSKLRIWMLSFPKRMVYTFLQKWIKGYDSNTYIWYMSIEDVLYYTTVMVSINDMCLF